MASIGVECGVSSLTESLTCSQHARHPTRGAAFPRNSFIVGIALALRDAPVTACRIGAWYPTPSVSQALQLFDPSSGPGRISIPILPSLHCRQRYSLWNWKINSPCLLVSPGLSILTSRPNTHELDRSRPSDDIPPRCRCKLLPRKRHFTPRERQAARRAWLTSSAASRNRGRSTSRSR